MIISAKIKNSVYKRSNMNVNMELNFVKGDGVVRCTVYIIPCMTEKQALYSNII